MTRRLSLLLLVLGAFVFLLPTAAAGGGCHAGPSAVLTASTDTTVTIGGCVYDDTVTYVQPGDKVTWTNKDPVPHTVTGVASSWGGEKFLDRGDKISYEFQDEGVYPYYCALHPSMVGAVVVGDAAAMLDGAAGRVEEVDDASAAAASAQSSERDGRGLTATTGIGIGAGLIAAVVVARLALRRRVHATPV